jgi:head-tail adaptor
MSLAKLLNQPLELHKNTHTVDEYGNQVSIDSGSPVVIYGYLEQVTSTEFLEDRDTIVSAWRVFLPAGTDVTAFDRIKFNGQTFELDGAPWSVYNPRVGSVSHIQANLKVVL